MNSQMIMWNTRLFVLSMCAIGSCTMEGSEGMKTYKIDLPSHELHFSLPAEIANEMSAVQVEARFDPMDPKFLKTGFRQLAAHLHDFKGPFWGGALGSLKFGFTIQRRRPDYAPDISNPEQLYDYIRWWIGSGKYAMDFTISRAKLNGMPGVCRAWDRFGDPRTPEPENLEIFSLPISDQLFLDINFSITEWQGGRGKETKWLSKAEAMRDAIKATIVLKRKTTSDSDAQ